MTLASTLKIKEQRVHPLPDILHLMHHSGPSPVKLHPLLAQDDKDREVLREKNHP